MSLSGLASTLSSGGWPVLSFQPQASFVSPRMSRDTAAVMHKRRPHPAGNTVAQEDDIRLLWRRVPVVRDKHFFRRSQPPQDQWLGHTTRVLRWRGVGGVERRRCGRVGGTIASLFKAALVRVPARRVLATTYLLRLCERSLQPCFQPLPESQSWGWRFHLGRVCGWCICRSDSIHVHTCIKSKFDVSSFLCDINQFSPDAPMML